MKRRALILMLALVLVLGMFPVTAFAADRKTSDACVDVIKYFEGFRKYPYWDYYQYTVGYGTRCPDDKLEEYKKNGITEAEAEALLQKELKSTETTINKFDDKYDLDLSQHQFDALVSFTYNVGGNWTTGTTQLFTKAVINGYTGNDFIFAMTLWSNAGGSMSLGLVQRRLIEANMYLNGEYSTKVADNFDYVTFNHTNSTYNGSTQAYRVQGYDSSRGDYVRPEGKKDGYRFLGWYTKSTSGEWISTLNSSTAGKTLYAHWQKGEGNVDSSGKIQGTEASYVRTATESVKVYAQPSLDGGFIGTVARGAKMTIVADYVDADGVKWGRLEQGGWVCLSSASSNGSGSETPAEPTDPPAEEKVIATGTVKLSSGSLNVRKGPGTSYAKVGSVSNGDKVEIYELKTVSGVQWGRIAKGWISMEFVVLDKEEEEEKPTEPEPTEPEENEPEAGEAVIAVGSVKISSGSMNIRKGPGTSYAKAGTLSNGDRVELYEIRNVSGVQWGRMSKGWLNLNYVKLASSAMIRSGVNVRKGAGASYAKVGSYKAGTVVFVHETKKVGTGTWGRTDLGWFNLSYANMAVSGTVTGSSVNVRSGAGTSYGVVGSYKKNAVINVYETKKVGSATWGHADKGWLNLSYVKLDGSVSSGSSDNTAAAAVRTGTVTASGNLNVRKGAGASYAKVGSVSSGDKLTVTALKLVDGSAWGKISTGWVCLDYVKMDAPAAGAPALIMGDDLNIRKGAGTSYAKVGQYDKGVVVTILQTKTVSGTKWGQTDKGWVSMDFVL